MALFGSDRPVMPSFKTPPEPNSPVRSPYDDLNRLERNLERNNDRNPERRDDRNPEPSLSRHLDRPDDRNEADVRTQERLERIVERNGREGDREPIPAAIAAGKASQPSLRKRADEADPLIHGLFSKLPEPETEWPLAARQKWLQTAANIFDLMYAPNHADAGELAIRVERSAAR